MNDSELHIRLLVAESEANRLFLADAAAVWLQRIRMVDTGLGIIDAAIAMDWSGARTGSTASIIAGVMKACTWLSAGSRKAGGPHAPVAGAAQAARPATGGGMGIDRPCRQA